MAKEYVMSKAEASTINDLRNRVNSCTAELLNICQVLRNMSCNDFCSDEEIEFNNKISEEYAEFLASIKGDVQEVSDKIQGFLDAYSDRKVVEKDPFLREIEVDENSWGYSANYEESPHVYGVLDEKQLKQFRDEWKTAFMNRKK